MLDEHRVNGSGLMFRLRSPIAPPIGGPRSEKRMYADLVPDDDGVVDLRNGL